MGSVPDSLVSLPGYTMFRRDRAPNLSSRNPHVAGGGIAVYIKSTIPAVLYHISRSHECIWNHLKLPERSMFVCCLYSPPRSDESIYKRLLDDVSRIEESFHEPYIVVCGDFNCHHRSWLGHQATDSNGIAAKGFSDECGLVQMTPFSTRDPSRGPDSILDLILTNIPNSSSVTMSPALGSSDHLVISWKSVLRSARHSLPTKRKVWLYDKADWDGLREAMAEFPFKELATGDVDRDWATFRDVFVDYIDCFIPSKWKRTVAEGSKLWFSEDCELAMRSKNLAFQTWKANPTVSNLQAYRRTRNYAISVFRRSRDAYILRVRQDLSNSSPSHRSWWHTIRQVTGRAVSSVPTLVDNGGIYHKSLDKANVLNDYMADQCTVPNPGASVPPGSNGAIKLDTVAFTPAIALRYLSKVDATKVNGPDMIAARVIKKCAPEIAEPLSNLFNSSFLNSRLPSQWKEANVTPVFKKDDRSSPTNYRPISLLCIISKVMEAIIADDLRNFLFSNNLISQRQFGFRPGHSALDMLISLTQRWSDALNNKWEVRAVSLDISRAFDTVWHPALLSKLRSIGVDGTLLAWISDFLVGRRQRVVLDGASSNFRNISAGVPQGSVLGPVLFLVYINDLGQSLENDLFLFADDSTLFRIIRTPADRVAAAESLNRDLNRILEWSRTWNMSFNPAKFQAITFSFKDQCFPQPPLCFSGFSIHDSKTFKILGITLSPKLSWKEHLTTVAERANRQLGALRRARRYLCQNSLVTLYKSIVRSTLEYCCPLWIGAPNVDLDLLDRIQRRGVSILGLTDNDLARYGIQTLHHRRLVSGLTVFYKMVNNLAPLELTSLLPGRRRSVRTTRSVSTYPDALEVPFSYKVVHDRSFIRYFTEKWNTLPPTVVSSGSVSSFKKNVHNHLLYISRLVVV